MRIAMISEHADPLATLGGADAGGQNLHVAELSAALAAAGHEVTVYTRHSDRHGPRTRQTPAGYRVVRVPAGPAAPVPRDDLLPYMGEFSRYLDRCWRTDRPDVAHAHFWMSGLATIGPARRHGVPFLHTYHALGTVKRRHQGTADTSPPSRIRTERMIGRAAAAIIATCGDEVRELTSLGVPRTRIEVVPCGVDCDRFRPGDPPPPRAVRRIVSVGRLVPRKGFGDLLAALPAIPATELVVAGGPDPAGLAADAEATRLRELAARLGVADRFRLLGRVPRDRMPGVLGSADLVACAPWYEPFGIVPLEAMACGVPVLATAVGGLTDTVVHGVTGVLVPPRRPEAMAAAATALLGDPGTRASFGAAGRERAESRYRWSAVAAATERVYDRVGARDRAQSLAGAGSAR